VHFGCLKGGNKLGEIIMEIRKSNRLWNQAITDALLLCLELCYDVNWNYWR
jgi:hypothetical protein